MCGCVRRNAGSVARCAVLRRFASQLQTSRVAAIQSQNDAPAWAVAENIGFTPQTRRIMRAGKVVTPPLIVSVGRHAGFLKAGELGDIIRPACFGARSEAGTLPSAKGLALYDGAGDGAIDVNVARLDLLAPNGDFIFVERGQTRCQAEIIVVLDGHGLVQTSGPDQAQRPAEALGAMKPGAALDAQFDAGRPESWVVTKLARRQQPFLACIQGCQCSPQVFARRTNQRRHHAGRICRYSDGQTAGGIEQLRAESRVIINLRFQYSQAGRAAFLSRVIEGGLDEVFHREVAIRL